jgi:hypothetical protein
VKLNQIFLSMVLNELINFYLYFGGIKKNFFPLFILYLHVKTLQWEQIIFKIVIAAQQQITLGTCL